MRTNTQDPSKRPAQAYVLSEKYMGIFQRISLALLTLSLFVVALMQIQFAQADGIKDVPEVLKISAATSDYGASSMVSYPKLFGSSERSSVRIAPFTKWSAMFQRLNYQTRGSSEALDVLKVQLGALTQTSDSVYQLAASVNDMMNAKAYVSDARNYGRSDFWASLPEFLERGGDCEDYAIAKYTALRMAGVSEDRLRIAIVQDTWKNIAHAVLVVYTEHGPYVLDNQNKEMVSASSAGRYRPIFSINRTAWWLHKAPAYTQVASLN